MKRDIILAALIAAFVFTTATYGQSGGVTISIADQPDTNRIQIDSVFPTTYNGGVRVSEARLPATTQLACMASTDFSSAVPMNPARYTVAYDTATNAYLFSFSVERATKTSCRIVRFNNDGDVDGRDFLMWQRGGSPNALAFGEAVKEGSSDARGSDGSVRMVQYSISRSY